MKQITLIISLLFFVAACAVPNQHDDATLERDRDVRDLPTPPPPTPDPIDEVVEYAMSFEGTPYIWGGDDRNGIDCSGLIIEILNYAGVLPYGYDNTAHGLFRQFSHNGVSPTPMTGALAVYGRSYRRIKHIAFSLGDGTVLEAGGGDRRTRRPTRDAKVRVKPHNYRRDFLGYVMPDYLWDERTMVALND